MITHSTASTCDSESALVELYGPIRNPFHVLFDVDPGGFLHEIGDDAEIELWAEEPAEDEHQELYNQMYEELHEDIDDYYPYYDLFGEDEADSDIVDDLFADDDINEDQDISVSEPESPMPDANEIDEPHDDLYMSLADAADTFDNFEPDYDTTGYKSFDVDIYEPCDNPDNELYKIDIVDTYHIDGGYSQEIHAIDLDDCRDGKSCDVEVFDLNDYGIDRSYEVEGVGQYIDECGLFPESENEDVGFPNDIWDGDIYTGCKDIFPDWDDLY